MIVADRVRTRLGELGLSQAELARRVGITQQAVGKVVRGEVRGSAHLHRIAQALQTTPAWLEGETDDAGAAVPPLPIETTVGRLGLIMVPELGQDFGLGLAVVDDEDAHVRMVAFPRSWLGARTGGKGHYLLIQGSGDSMVPTIHDGDDVLVDRGQDRINQQDRIWALTYGELGIIKRVRRLSNGRYQLNADNAAVSPIEAEEGEFKVIGRVLWIGRRI